MTHNLDQLLKDLELDTGLEKVASEIVPNIDKELADMLVVKDERSLTKKAQLAGEAMAAELLEKFATEISKGNDEMVAAAPAATPVSEGTVAEVAEETIQKAIDSGVQQADQADTVYDSQKDNDMKKLAAAIMEKLAEGTEISADNNEMVATQAAADPTPSQGQPNEVLQAIVDKTVDAGATSNMVDADSVEKAAACQALTEAGMSFEDAVTLVKQAENALVAEDFEMQKRAALGELLEAGVDYDTAVDLVKEASDELEKVAYPTMADQRKEQAVAELSVLDKIKKGFKSANHSVQDAGHSLADNVAIAFNDGGAGLKGQALKNIMKNPITKAVGAAGLVGGGIYAAKKVMDHKKTAALGELLEAGVDYDTAVDLVKEAVASLEA